MTLLKNFRITGTILVLVYLSQASNAQLRTPANATTLKEVVYRDSVIENRFYREGTSYIEFIIGETDILPDYKNNNEELDKVRKCLGSITGNPDAKILEVSVVGYGSPDGGYNVNKRIAAGRAASFSEYIRLFLSGVGYPIKYNVSSVPEDWEGLKKLIREEIPVPGEEQYLPKQQILDAIDGAPSPGDIKKRVMDLDHGDPYRYMLKYLFPKLRRAYYRINYEIVETDNIRLADTLTVTVPKEPDTVKYDSYYVTRRTRRPITGIKTNLLYWATLTPNLGIDFYIGKKISLGIEGSYSDWTLFQNDVDRIKRWNNWSAGGEFRFWTRSNAKGHFIGLHGNYIDYNFLLNKTGQAGRAYGGGIVYGFLVKVRERLDFEFEIGAGCFYADGNKFVYTKAENPNAKYPVPVVTECYKKYYFGPTKINISLIHRF